MILVNALPAVILSTVSHNSRNHFHGRTVALDGGKQGSVDMR